MTTDTEEAQVAQNVARWLLDIGVVALSPRKPYTWASGVSSPIYCDCRRIMSFPPARTSIEDSWAALVRATWPEVRGIVGVATGGIPHAAFVAERLGLPMGYVRAAAKGHGLGKRLEGALEKGTPVVVLEDLVSTGTSLLDAVKAASEEGLRVLGATAVFTYELPQASENFGKAGVRLVTLTRLSAVRDLARASGALSAEDLTLLSQGMESVVQQLRSRQA